MGSNCIYFGAVASGGAVCRPWNGDGAWQTRHAGPRSIRPADIATRAIPHSGERIPVIGLGTANDFQVAPKAKQEPTSRKSSMTCWRRAAS